MIRPVCRIKAERIWSGFGSCIFLRKRDRESARNVGGKILLREFFAVTCGFFESGFSYFNSILSDNGVFLKHLNYY